MRKTALKFCLSLMFVLMASCGATQEQNPRYEEEPKGQQDPKQPDNTPKAFKAILTIQDQAKKCSGTLCEVYSATQHPLHFTPEKDKRHVYVATDSTIKLKPSRSYSVRFEFIGIPFTPNNELTTDVHIVTDNEFVTQLCGMRKTVGKSDDGVHALSFKFIVDEAKTAEIFKASDKQLYLAFTFYKPNMGHPFLTVAMPVQFEEEQE